MELSEITERLNDRVEDLCQRLLPDGERKGAEWYVSGSRSPTGGAIGVVLRGNKRGVVGFFQGSKPGGGLLNLIQEVNGGSFADAVKWAKGYLGISEDMPAPDPEQQRRAEERRRQRRLKEEADKARKHETVAYVWKNSTAIKGTLGEQYLISRGLQMREWPSCLRFMSSLYHAPSKSSWPALVCAVQQANGSGTAIWRIWIKKDGSGKAPVDPAKMGLGEAKGGAVRLGKPARVIGLAEGVETSLACCEIAMFQMPVWAGLSTSGIQTFEPPEGVEEIHVFADNDRVKVINGRKVIPGMNAALQLQHRLKDSHKVVIMPPRKYGSDWLDVLNITKQKLRA
jgi:hypothetical protein